VYALEFVLDTPGNHLSGPKVQNEKNGSLNRVFGEHWAKMTHGGGASTLCGISSTIEFFNRLNV